MPAIRWTPVAFLVSLALAACSPNGKDNGVGPDLYTGSLPENTKAQNDYISGICIQAGGQLVRLVDSVDCNVNGGWTSFVQAGMNDIDARCDSYLVWLDAKKRHQAPVLKEISDTQNAATAIIEAATPGSRAIGVLTQVFGLAADTFTNVNNGLLLQVDHSTVQTVVLGRQNEFRQALLGKTVKSRPEAIYVLRSYLRICMPITIATDINTTISAMERTDMPPSALIDAGTVADSLIGSPTAPLPPGPPPPPPLPNRLTAQERALLPAFFRSLQSTLCVKVDGDPGPLGSNTRAAISTYLDGHESAPSQTITPANMPALTAAIDAVPGCSTAGYKNAYEVAVFGVPAPGTTTAMKVASFQQKLAKYLALKQSSVAVTLTEHLDPQTRTAIAAARQLADLGDGNLGDQLDKKLYIAILSGT